MAPRWRSLRLLLAPCALVLATCDADLRPQVLVAASFEEAATRVLGDTARVAPAASSIHARRIVEGAAGDAFVSANPEWMDYLQQRGRIVPGSRRPLVGNEIVLVMPGAGRPPLDLQAFHGRIAMGDPSHVPAGVYGRRALQGAGVWRRWARHIVPTADVRQALALVERDEVDLGVVYRTDALRTSRVSIVHRFDPARAPVVRYEIALLPGGDPAVVQRLTGAAAQAIYRQAGFRPLRP